MHRHCMNPNGDTICRKGCAGNARCDYFNHPANWSAPVPLSEARKTDPLIEEVARAIERGDVDFS